MKLKGEVKISASPGERGEANTFLSSFVLRETAQKHPLSTLPCRQTDAFRGERLVGHEAALDKGRGAWPGSRAQTLGTLQRKQK